VCKLPRLPIPDLDGTTSQGEGEGEDEGGDEDEGSYSKSWPLFSAFRSQSFRSVFLSASSSLMFRLSLKLSLLQSLSFPEVLVLCLLSSVGSLCPCLSSCLVFVFCPILCLPF
jgi:hypothetical protein